MPPLNILKEMPKLTLLHDPHCSVSGDTLQALLLGGHHPAVRRISMPSDYLTERELRDLTGRLIGDPVDALVRRGRRYQRLGLELDGADAETVIGVLVEHPELLQRPILDDGTDVMIGRPPARAEAWAITGHVIDAPLGHEALLRAA